jgi:serine/threonine protein kinase
MASAIAQVSIEQASIGQLLMGRYLLLEHLEVGGFSQTYLTVDIERPSDPCHVLKIMDQQLNPELDFCSLHNFFEAEAYALGRLGAMQPIGITHLPVPQLIAYCRDRSQVYLVQEFIEGERLDHWMQRVPRPRFKQVLQLLAEVLLILYQIHARGIIHCDIKPNNLIRRNHDGKLILIDFGACYLQDTKTRALPNPDTKSDDRKEFALGTPGYMPEEQAAGAPEFNSDLYALGMMMIQIITGVAPQELELHPMGHSWQWIQYVDKPFSTSRLIPILDRMIQLDPRDRYPTVAAVIDELQDVLMQGSHTYPYEPRQITALQSNGNQPAPTICKQLRSVKPITPDVPPTRSCKIVAS